MSTVITVRAATTAVLAGVLTLVTLAVLPPVLAWMSAVVLAVCLVHHLAPADRTQPARRSSPQGDSEPVLVCHCHRVNDAHIDQVLAAGAGGVGGVVRATRAGTGCGGCLPMLRELCKPMSASCELHDDEGFAG